MKNLSVGNNEAADVFKEVFRKIGWGDQQIKLIEQALQPFGEGLQLAVLFTFPTSMEDVRTNKTFMTHFKNLLELVRNSELVREEREDLEHKLKMVNLASDELLARVKELEKYKTHYEMQINIKRLEAGLCTLAEAEAKRD